MPRNMSFAMTTDQIAQIDSLLGSPREHLKRPSIIHVEENFLALLRSNIQSLTVQLAKRDARIAELEAEQDLKPHWFLWRPEGKVPFIKGPFNTVTLALNFAHELYEINKKTPVTVIDKYLPNRIGGDSLDNFIAIHGDRRTKEVRRYLAKNKPNPETETRIG